MMPFLGLWFNTNGRKEYCLLHSYLSSALDSWKCINCTLSRHSVQSQNRKEGALGVVLRILKAPGQILSALAFMFSFLFAAAFSSSLFSNYTKRYCMCVPACVHACFSQIAYQKYCYEISLINSWLS